MRLAGADDAGIAGDGVFDVGVALDNLVGYAFEEFAAVGGVLQDDGSSLVVVHFGVILGNSPVVAQGDVCDAGQLAVTAFDAGVVLANAAQEQAHVFRTVMMLGNGFPRLEPMLQRIAAPSFCFVTEIDDVQS